MGVGAVFLLVVVIVVVVLIALVLTGNAGWLGWHGSDPQRQAPPGTTPEPSDQERPTHTVVDLEQSENRETRGVPTD
jgi:hypothetical protein